MEPLYINIHEAEKEVKPSQKDTGEGFFVIDYELDFTIDYGCP